MLFRESSAEKEGEAERRAFRANLRALEFELMDRRFNLFRIKACFGQGFKGSAQEGEDCFRAFLITSFTDKRPGSFTHLHVKRGISHCAESRLKKRQFERRYVGIGQKRIE